jgi:hypothetical protein
MTDELDEFSIEEWSARDPKERARYGNPVQAFRNAVRESDIEAFFRSFTAVEKRKAFFRAFKAIVGLEPTAEFRNGFLSIWRTRRESLRVAVGDDQTLVRGLKAILPRYDGPSVKLYRGEAWENHRHRSYGFSWTSRVTIAKGYAQSGASVCLGGSVLIETVAPSDAIVYARSIEGDYVVDRRLLKDVIPLRRFVAQPPA